jgi:hypothetical protein
MSTFTSVSAVGRRIDSAAATMFSAGVDQGVADRYVADWRRRFQTPFDEASEAWTTLVADTGITPAGRGPRARPILAKMGATLTEARRERDQAVESVDRIRRAITSWPGRPAEARAEDVALEIEARAVLRGMSDQVQRREYHAAIRARNVVVVRAIEQSPLPFFNDDVGRGFEAEMAKGAEIKIESAPEDQRRRLEHATAIAMGLESVVTACEQETAAVARQAGLNPGEFGATV